LVVAPNSVFCALRKKKEYALDDEILEVKDESEAEDAVDDSNPNAHHGELTLMFNNLDRNRDGLHDENEIALHIQVNSLKQVSDEVDELDKDGDGRIGISEWQAKFFKGKSIHQYQASLGKDDGQLSVNDINLAHHKRTMEGRNSPVEFHAQFWEIAQARARELVMEVDKDGDGKISEGEHNAWHLEL
jgi:hypothetical protein